MLDDDFVETLVIDNGTWMCRAGWAGADSARAYCRTVIGKYDGRKVCNNEFTLQDILSLDLFLILANRLFIKGC